MERADDISAYGPRNTTDDILSYYDHKAELVIQCDACQKSLLYYEAESTSFMLTVPWPIPRQDMHTNRKIIGGSSGVLSRDATPLQLWTTSLGEKWPQTASQSLKDL